MRASVARPFLDYATWPFTLIIVIFFFTITITITISSKTDIVHGWIPTEIL